ncbi:MAG: hypothetical protein J0L62_06280 [Bacteroidetes bacterium]|nr:hypothetical protein [Bacteroidota bacterium]
MLSTNQNLFKLCLLMAVLAVFAPVGFAQQVMVLPSKAIDISEPNTSPEENSISISTQNITGNENFVVTVSVNLEVVPNLSAPVIKVDNVLYATDGDLVYKKNNIQSSWEIADRSEQPEQLTISKSALTEPECNCETELPASENLHFDGSNQIQLPARSLSATTNKNSFFSTNNLPVDFPFQFSETVTSVFYQNGISERLDVVLGNEIQLSFLKEGENWVSIDWLVLDETTKSLLTNANIRGFLLPSEGFLPGSFSSQKNYSFSTPILVNSLNLNLADLEFVPPVNHIASGWSPTLGAVYDRNVVFNLISSSNLQTLSSFYTAILNLDNINSRPTDKFSLFFEILQEKNSLSGQSFKGTLT